MRGTKLSYLSGPTVHSLYCAHTLSAIGSQENTVQHEQFQYRSCFHSYRLRDFHYNLVLDSKIIAEDKQKLSIDREHKDFEHIFRQIFYRKTREI